ncbi:MAG: hypothetical protein ACRCZF_08800 [Gemmataceae bacterium]
MGDDRCTACLLLDVDAGGLVRGRKLDQDFLHVTTLRVPTL